MKTSWITFAMIFGFLAGCGNDVTDVEQEYLSTIKQEHVQAPDFKLGIRLADGSASTAGAWKYTYYTANQGTSVSEFACDSNCYDPNEMQIDLKVPNTSDLLTKDFSIGLRACDGTSSNPEQYCGSWKYTPWASDGGGMSDVATDSNGVDPNTYQIGIRTRSIPITTHDFRVGIKAYDGSLEKWAGPWQFTPTAKSGGGVSPWATDANGIDPNGFRLWLIVWSCADVNELCNDGHSCCEGLYCEDGTCHAIR